MAKNIERGASYCAVYSANDAIPAHTCWLTVARGISNQAVPATTWTQVQFNNKAAPNFDEGGDFDAAVTYQCVAPEDGKYWVAASVLATPQDGSWGATSDARIAIYVNGVSVRFVYQMPRDAASTTGNSNGITALLDLDAGDTVDIRVRYSEAANVNYGSGTWLSISRAP